MSLIQPRTFAFGSVFPNAYHLIGAVQHQVINHSVIVGVVSYADSDTRDRVKLATADYEATLSVSQAKEAVWNAAADGQKTPPYLDYQMSLMALETAQNALAAIQPLPGDTDQYVISGSDYQTVLNSAGDPDRAAIYAWLKKQAKWTGAKDA